VAAFSTGQSATRDDAPPRASVLNDLFPAAERSSGSVAPQAAFAAAIARAVPGAHDQVVSALHARVEELSRLLDQTRDKLMTEKGRITKLQTRIDKLPRS
jgi:hypothetical protein